MHSNKGYRPLSKGFTYIVFFLSSLFVLGKGVRLLVSQTPLSFFTYLCDMYLHDYLILSLEWLTAIFVTGVLLVLAFTVWMFLAGIVYVWLKEFHPKVYRWIRKKILRY